ncbi:MAG: formate dehydrogenase accessory sulfurtransferase FdhD [Desulfotomaculaceae bacterium]|nr:formate dehydrogenase accessory sulfurtransferase FdhD [Desulfotomaculaceae bacterium]
MFELKETCTKMPVTRYRKGVFSTGEDLIIKEVPVTLILNNFEFATMVCSPCDLKEMAIGFLYSEGLVQQPADLKSITVDEASKTIRVETTGETSLEERFVKRLVTTSCTRGGPSLYFFDSARKVFPVSTDIKITPGEILYLCDEVEKVTPLFRATGGSHSAALCTNEKIIVYFEDVGRHNAVDRVSGRCLLYNIDMSDKILVFSGRVSSEILIKVAKMGIPLIAARSAPTELAVNLAKEFGITIVAFIRTDKFTIYSHESRVVGSCPC